MKININTQNMGVTSHLSVLIFKKNDMIQIEDKHFHVFKNDLIIARDHCSYHLKKEDSLISIDFDKDCFDSLFLSQIADCRIFYELLTESETDNEFLFFHNENHPDIITYTTCLINETSRDVIQNNKMSFVCLTALFTALDRCRDETLVVQNSTMGSRNRFGKMMDYIGRNYNTCSLQEVAEIFGYNPDYLSQRFKQITGVSFREKIRSMRLEEAMQLLKISNLTIEEISTEIGFRDKSWFIKKFKEKTGYTPSAYRKQYALSNEKQELS